VIDISPRVGAGVRVWQGDSAFSWEWTAARARGDAVNLGRMGLSPHTGAHADAPRHVDDAGADIASLPLEVFWGPARVVDWTRRGTMDRRALAALEWAGVQRVLFRTRRDGEPLTYGPVFPALTADGAAFLCERGLRLVGVDVPSVDPYDSADLAAHHVLADAGIAILECLELGAVAAGDYELAALPLRIEGAEASPVRAALRARD
jgi:arylformamidase